MGVDLIRLRRSLHARNTCIYICQSSFGALSPFLDDDDLIQKPSQHPVESVLIHVLGNDEVEWGEDGNKLKLHCLTWMAEGFCIRMKTQDMTTSRSELVI